MNSRVLVTEDELDARLMNNILANDSVQYIPAGGWSSADSLARSYLTDPGTKVAVVVDSDSLDPNVTEERRRFLKRSLGQIAQADSWRVLVIMPEIAVILFENRNILIHLVGQRISDTDFVRGQYEPRKVLGELLGGLPLSEIYERLITIDWSPIRNKPEIQDLQTFFRSNRKDVNHQGNNTFRQTRREQSERTK